MYELACQLFPLCRSITGEGVRQTLRVLKEHIPLEIHEIPSGAPVFDWTVPKEWNIKGAYIKDSRGKIIVDFKDSNLHVLNYSVPVSTKLSLEELKEHLFTLPEHPDWIPYRTAYYKEDWGFCLTHKQFMSLDPGEYEVVIDSSLAPGHLTYGECYLPGETSDEVLVSCHICHPSLCNDNLSGIAVSTFLAKAIGEISHRYSYRFLFVPGTIGSISWLCINEGHVSKVKHGFVAACLGDPGPFTYKKSRRGDADIDKAMLSVLRDSGRPFRTIDFVPYGYDERQYGSPGFDLPVGCLMRTPYGEYPEYHTSADNLNLVGPMQLGESLSIGASVLHVLECNRKYRNLNPKCEPQLGRRGLYGKIGGASDAKIKQLALLWVLNLSDGNHTLLEISDRSGLEFGLIRDAAEILLEHGLLGECLE